MESVSEGLRKLHLLHLESHETLQKLERGPKLIANRKKKTAAKLQEVEDQKAQITEFRKAADQKSLQLKTNEARIIDLKGKLNAAASNREYEVITSQIDADEMANSVLEDEILEALDKVDRAITQLGEIEEEHKAAIKNEQELAQRIESERPSLEADAEVHKAAIKQAERVIPEKHKEMYRRLVKRDGAGALASVEDNACSNCFETLNAQEKVRINLGEFFFCRECNRILYKVES